ncbi:ankyrin repeat domain-containing protein [Corynebacterium sp. ES2715-CONJ3]|uniref:ankyrin repeat domain-containing protein n=1 Tax=Corynebacterium sp. ES2715-CONJ3 TaxID=2974028 RepID=UPI002169755B|nr:ankyrin repeat domain-containing protein [Corynebacterium sp. ES2715-CONJ3]MCS4492301.1 ankyrin repeat domain-containing protein [Corynebacterium sp. ES2715-CONJ3]
MTTPSPDPELQAFINELFHLARTGGEPACDRLRTLVSLGLNPNISNEEGNTLLMIAAYSGHADIVRELINMGADLNQLNDRGQSPLAGAIFKKYPEVIATLINHGADPHIGHPSAYNTAKMFELSDLVAHLDAHDSGDKR